MKNKIMENLEKYERTNGENQGRSDRQVRNNETIAAVSVLGLILTAFIAAIYNYIIA